MKIIIIYYSLFSFLFISKSIEPKLELLYDNTFLVKSEKDVFFIFRSDKGVKCIVATNEIALLNSISAAIHSDSTVSFNEKTIHLQLTFMFNKSKVSVKVNEIKSGLTTIKSSVIDKKIEEEFSNIKFYTLNNLEYYNKPKMTQNCWIYLKLQ